VAAFSITVEVDTTFAATGFADVVPGTARVAAMNAGAATAGTIPDA
jgi:hypothetical protein